MVPGPPGRGLSLGDLDERLGAGQVALGDLVGRRAVLGFLQPLLGVLELLLQLAGVELVGLDRLGDQHAARFAKTSSQPSPCA